MDRNKDGRVQPKERAKFRQDDTNHDGRIDAHEKIDRNDDGKIGAAEAAAARSKVNTPREKHYDADGDGKIDAAERKAMFDANDANDDGRIDRFERVDRNDDGTIGAKEAAAARHKVTNDLEKKYDADGNGWIGPAEAAAIRDDHPQWTPVGKAVYDAVDANDDGVIDKVESQNAAKRVVDSAIEKRFDADGDGRIGAAEAARLQQFRKADADGDGKISKDEALAAARAFADQHPELKKKFDADGDRQLDASEAAALLKEWRRKRQAAKE